MRFGLILSNRGPVLGYASAQELVALGVAAERCGAFDSVWSGDAFFVNPRFDAIVLLSAVAAQTRTIQLGPACMGSFTQRDALDLAYSWASLDVLAEGRSLMVACVGGGGANAWAREGKLTGVSADRRAVMWERIDLLRMLWRGKKTAFTGQFHHYDEIEIYPRPVRQPYPIWVATNITRLASGQTAGRLPKKTLSQIGLHCDGWMTHSLSADAFDEAWAHITASCARDDAAPLDNCLVFNICIHENPERALAESMVFLERYYGMPFSAERTQMWTAYGSPAQCAERLRAYKNSAVKRIALRITSTDQDGQFRRLVDEVLPLI